MVERYAMHKTCFKCGMTLDIEMFYKHPQMSDGRLGKCKDCAKVDVRRNRSLRSEYYNEYDRKRGSDPHRKAENLKRGRSGKNRAKHKEAIAAAKMKYPYKSEARMKTGNAIRDGLLKRMPCSVCGDTKSDAHHEDYTKPLDVVWFCRKHHAERHKEINKIARILIAEKNWCNGW